MGTFFRKQLPIIIAFVMGMIMLIRYYVPHPVSETVYNLFIDWVIIISGFVMILGILSLLHYHWNKIKRRKPGFAFSFVTYGAFLVMMITGFVSGFRAETGTPMEQGTGFHWMYVNLMVPMQSTMFAILGFFVASAAFRAFRARNPEATMLLIAAILVMLGRVPIGEAMWTIKSAAGADIHPFSVVSSWILDVLNTAGQRGIMLGVGLSQVAIALRILFGIERTYMGGGE
ncbi:MAG: hypothetical protein HRF49_05410 [bacterium]|jgi:hypothetical protein